MSSRRRRSRTGPPGREDAGQGQPDRRTFVRTAAGVIAAATGMTAIPGCEGGGTEPPPPPPGTGTLRATVTGLGGATSGGFVTISSATDTATLPMPAPSGGTSIGDLTGVPPGTYTASYTPPPGFELVNPSQSPQTITVVADQTQQFTLACQAIASGVIQVTAAGLTGATAGGSASAILADNTGPTFTATLAVPVGGSSTGSLTGLPAGIYAVTYTPPAGFQLTAASSGPAFVTVAVGGSATASFACQTIPVGALLFASDWSTALGTSDAALRDTSKAKPWNVVNNGFGVLEVVSAAGKGFPPGMQNCLRVAHLATTVRFGDVRADNLWPVPAAGESLYFRLYLRNEIADTEGDFSGIINSHHPIQPASGTCVGSWNWTYATRNNGTFPVGFNTEMNPFPRNRWVLGNPRQNLQKFRTYRLEWRINRQSAGYAISVRVYDDTDTLVFDDTSLWDIALGATLATAPLHALDSACLSKFMVGTNGGNWQFTATQFDYFGGVMVRSDDWCGPY